MLRFFFTSLLIGLFTVSLAQDNFEGKITYKITYDRLPPEMESYKAMLPSKTVMYLKGSKSRTEQPAGMGGTQIMITDSKKGTGNLLMDMMGQKYSISIDHEKKKEQAPELDIEYIDESREIADHTCKKAIVSAKGTPQSIIVYYTNDIPYEQNDQFKGLKGFPLEYEVQQNGIEMTFSAKSVKEEAVSDSLFEVPEGYEEVTEQEFRRMIGG